MTSTLRALDDILTDSARLADQLASQGFIDAETYGALTKIICDMGRCWKDDEIEAFKVFHTLFLTRYHLVLWSMVLPNIAGRKMLPNFSGITPTVHVERDL